ncbi:MAG: hypothetical protein ABIF71_13615 [Planctomycetota bacterium]
MEPNEPHDRRPCPQEEDTAALAMNALEGAAETAARAHLEGCPACQTAFRRFQQVRAGLLALPSEPPVRDLAPDIVKAAVWRARDGQHPAAAFRPGWWRHAAIAAVACVLVLIGAGMWFMRPAGDTAISAVQPVISPWPLTATVTAASQWLVGSQKSTGEWIAVEWGGQPNYSLGVTGLAVLALASVEQSGIEQGVPQTLARGVEHILSLQSPEGRLGPECRPVLYNHGIATVALLEVYERKHAVELKGPIQKALDYIGRCQSVKGGWGYLEPSGRWTAPNTSITVWQLNALSLGRELGFTGCESAIDRGVAWFKTMVDASGAIAYSEPADRSPAESFTLSAMAAAYAPSMGRAIPGAPIAAAMDDRSVLKAAPDFYQWYALTYGLYYTNRDKYKAWFNELHRALDAMQIAEGPSRGSWEPVDQWGSAGGRVYTTSMAVLALRSEERATRITACIGD